MVGKSVSNYDILSKAGEGGMGVVYHARDRRLDRDVALKFLFPEMLRSDDARARFDREARTISSVSHPNIATLYACEDSAEGTFLVLEYLSGGSLSDRLKRAGRGGAAIPLERGLDWAIQLADGLAHAHRKGIVHRDIKPANVLFDSEDRVKLSDFGLAKRKLENDGVTRAGVTLGTAGYMAPEQVLGAEADAASDIYSVGVVLYELFTGQRPFSGDDTRGAFYQVLNEQPKTPRELRPDLPEDLNRLILRAIEKQPSRRPASMEEMASELRDIQAHIEVKRNTATQTFVVETATQHQNSATGTAMATGRSKKPWWMVAAASACLLLLAFSPARTWMMSRFAGTALPEERKLAVLMFENLDGGEDQAAFCNGLTDSVTTVITQMSQADESLWVVPASEVRSENVRSAREARRLFGVNLAITGSLRRLANEVKVTLNLVDAEQSKQLESQTVEVAAADLATLEPQIMQAVATMLRSRGTGSPRESPQPAGIAASAYEFYMQGRGFLQRFDLPENLDKATAAFESAIEKEPGYPLAQAGLGEAYLARHSLTQDSQWLAKAQAATERAIQLNPKLAAAHVNLCVLYTRTSRFEQAIAEGRTARDLDPLNADAYRALAQAYSSSGKDQEAEQTYRQAIDLRPGFWLPYKDLGVHYLNLGRFADAEKMFRAVIEKTPDNEWGYRNLATVYHFTGRFGEAEEQLQAAVSRKPTGEGYSNLGTIYYVQGRFADATKAYRMATELNPSDPIVWGNLGDSLRALPETRSKSAEVYRRAIDLGTRQLGINSKDPQLLLGLALYSAKLGNHADADRFLTRAQQIIPGHAPLLYQSAIVYELAGEREKSLRELKLALAKGYPADEVTKEPELAALRQDARYKRILNQ